MEKIILDLLRESGAETEEYEVFPGRSIVRGMIRGEAAASGACVPVPYGYSCSGRGDGLKILFRPGCREGRILGTGIL